MIPLSSLLSFGLVTFAASIIACACVTSKHYVAALLATITPFALGFAFGLNHVMRYEFFGAMSFIVGFVFFLVIDDETISRRARNAAIRRGLR